LGGSFAIVADGVDELAVGEEVGFWSIEREKLVGVGASV
jgi:hypothetical protein